MNGKKLIRNSTAEFLIFTGQVGEHLNTALLHREVMAEGLNSSES